MEIFNSYTKAVQFARQDYNNVGVFKTELNGEFCYTVMSQDKECLEEIIIRSGENVPEFRRVKPPYAFVLIGDAAREFEKEL